MKIVELIRGLIEFALAIRSGHPQNPLQQKSGAQSGQKNADQTLVHIHIPQSAIDAYKTADEERARYDQDERRIDNRRLLVEAIGVAFVIIGALAAIVTLYFIKESTDATKIAADAAASAAKTAAVTLTIENRPWITFGPRTPLEATDRWYAHIGSVNIGKTPAVAVSTPLEVMAFLPSKDLERFLRSLKIDPVPLGNISQMPNEPRAYTIPSKEAWNKRRADLIKSGEHAVVVFGRVEYAGTLQDDASSGPTYVTEFCFLHNPIGMPWSPCPWFKPALK
jgi:hypothetical protein